MHRGCIAYDSNANGYPEVYWNTAGNPASVAPQYGSRRSHIPIVANASVAPQYDGRRSNVPTVAWWMSGDLDINRMKYRAVCLPSSSSLSAYVQDDYGYCPNDVDIVTKEMCGAAAGELGLDFPTPWNWTEDNHHRGCVKSTDGKIYFNEASNPAPEAPQYSSDSVYHWKMGYRALCYERRVPPPSPTESRIPQWLVKSEYGYCESQHDIVSPKACGFAASKLGLPFWGEWVGSGLHKSCIVHDGRVYFNTASDAADVAPDHSSDDTANYFRMNYRALCFDRRRLDDGVEPCSARGGRSGTLYFQDDSPAPRFSICKRVFATCQNGVVSASPMTRDNHCQACFPGFFLVNDTCVPKTCTDIKADYHSQNCCDVG